MYVFVNFIVTFRLINASSTPMYVGVLRLDKMHYKKMYVA